MWQTKRAETNLLPLTYNIQCRNKAISGRRERRDAGGCDMVGLSVCTGRLLCMNLTCNCDILRCLHLQPMHRFFSWSLYQALFPKWATHFANSFKVCPSVMPGNAETKSSI